MPIQASEAHISSQSIHKLRILAIRQIQPLLVLQFHILRVRAQHDFLRVLPLAVPVDEQHVEQAHAPARDDGDLGGDVARRVAGAEGLGADDVADAFWIVSWMRRQTSLYDVGRGKRGRTSIRSDITQQQ